MIHDLSKYIIMKYIGEDENYTIYIYGMECMLNSVISTFLLIIIAILTDTLSETFLWIFMFCLIRHFIGGYHASSHHSCILWCISLGFLNACLGQIIHISACFSALLILACIPFILRYAPIVNTQKIYNPSKQLRDKCSAILILNLSMVICLFLPPPLRFSMIFSCISSIVLMMLCLHHTK